MLKSAMTTKHTPVFPSADARILFARNYANELRSFVHDADASGEPAHRLGEEALKAGWTEGGVAALHIRELGKGASQVLARPPGRARAALFLRKVLGPIAASVRVSQANNQTLRERNTVLRLHARELAQANSRLEAEVARREAAQRLLLQGRQRYRTLFHESQIMQKKLRHLTRQILLAQEEERKEISRELHDEVVQTLVGINVELAALGKGASNGMLSLRARIAQTQRLVTESVNTVHRFARELRPAVLDDLGLVPALRSFSENLANRKRFIIEFFTCAAVETLGSAVRTVLFRVAQEALTNIARHAKASRVVIRFSELPGIVRMEIADDGCSFAVDRVLQAKNQRRLGLVGMRERVEMVGGKLKIVSSPGLGTQVFAEVPLAAGRNK